VRTSFRAAAAACLAAALAMPAAADPPQPWTMQDLDAVSEAALAAAPEERYAATRQQQLLSLGLAFEKSGDRPAAHAAFAAAAQTATSESSDGFRILAVPRMAAAGAVEDAESLANSAINAQIRDKLLAAIEQVRNGGPNPFETPPRSAQADTPPNTDDVDSWLAYAKAQAKKGNAPEARSAAQHAAQLALAVDETALPTAARFEHEALLGRVFGVLNQLGAYDEALAAVQPMDNINRRQYYGFVVEAAVRAGDAASVERLVPVAIAAFVAPTPDWGSVQKLHRMLKALAPAGYREAARATFAELRRVHDDVTATPLYRPDLGMMAECQALTGDLPDALAIAEKLGPLVAPPGIGPAALVTAMTFANSKTPPTTSEVADRLAEVKAMEPALVPGPKAHALADIVAALAATGSVDKAIELEPGLEVEPRDILAQPRDQALAAIAEAQQQAGELHAALATALRITGRDTRFARLLALAAAPLRP
jgi:hypothetical protein